MSVDLQHSQSIEPAVRIRGLNVVYTTTQGDLSAVRDVNLDIKAGEITGIIGESGSGKSTLVMAFLNSVGKPGKIVSGSVVVPGIGDMLTIDRERQRKARGKELGLVFQAAQNSLNPLRKIGHQVLDLGRSHDVVDLRELVRKARDLLTRLGMDADRVLTSYQHELSGGMRQRVGIMFALILDAKIVILDEATTALDMLSQASVLEIVRTLHKERGLTTILVTHDMGVVADMANRVVVMYGGEIVEEGPSEAVLTQPSHPYTQGLVQAIPRISGDIDRAVPLQGLPASMKSYLEPGCPFYLRCPVAMAKCQTNRPTSVAVSEDRKVACFKVTDHD